MCLSWDVKYQMHTQEYKDAWLILENTTAPRHNVELVQATRQNSSIHALYIRQ
jgi:hypothetical protein